PIPSAPAHIETRVLGEYGDFLHGNATLKLIRLETGPARAPQIDLMMVVPKLKPGPVPAFLAMNFCGNYAVTDDPRVPLARGWMYDGFKGVTNHTATEAGRGSQVTNWPLAEIVRRGYALVTFYSGDIDSDRQDASQGLYSWLAANDPAKNNPT